MKIKKEGFILARVLSLTDEVTYKSVSDIIEKIQNCNIEDNKEDEKQKDYKREPIHIMINSPGGNAYSGFGLATMIKASKTPIYTYCVGEAMSAAFLIFIAGHKRYTYKGSTFLYHQLSHGSYEKLNNLNRTIEFDNKLQKNIDEFIREYTKITEIQMKDVNEKNHDWYITADEALELEIVDEIL
jgi:ATP-dependent Clp protease protease subunit